MPAAPLPHDEADRLTALACLDILDTPPEERFDRVTRVAAALFRTEIAAINLIDAERQWTKSGIGTDPGAMPRERSFCQHVVATGAPIVVHELASDARFCDLPLVTNAPNLRFYAGVPLRSAAGHVLGTLCLADTRSRTLTPDELALLQDLAAWAERELTTVELREALRWQQRSDARFHAAVEATFDAFFVFESVRDGNGQIVDFRIAYANQQADRFRAAPPAPTQGQLASEYFPAAHAAEFFARCRQVIESRVPYEDERFVAAPGMPAAWIHHQIVPLDDGIAITMRDITVRKHAEATIAATNERLAATVSELEARARTLTLLHELSDLLHECKSLDEALGVTAMSARELFPTTSGAVYVRRGMASELTLAYEWGVAPPAPPGVDGDCLALQTRRLHYAAPHATQRCRHHRASEHGQLCAPLVVQGETLGVIHVLDHSCPADDASLERDVQRDLARAVVDQVGLALANIQLREELRQQAIRDPLTGLYNRRYLDDAFERELARAERAGRPLSVLVADIDHFKCFNDSWGHAAGDAVLRAVGRLLVRNVRGCDIVARVGGEELVILMPDSAANNALQRAEQLRLLVCSLQIEHDPPLPRVTVSIGVAAFPDHGLHVDAILAAADDALYAAKRAGRNQVRLGAAPGGPCGGSLAAATT